MLTERDLKIGKWYRYFSTSKGKYIDVIYEGIRNGIFIFRTVDLNEIWSYDLVGISTE